MGFFRSTGEGWIGIDVGTRSIKVAQIERAGEALRLREALVVPRPEQSNASEHSLITAAQLRAALSLSDSLQGRDAACVLPAHLCQLRECAVAISGVAEERALVAQELATLEGHSLDHDEFDYWPQEGGSTGSSGTSFGTVAAKRKITIDLERSLSCAGLRCRVLDAPPTALARAAQFVRFDRTHAPLAILDWGYRNATFCIAISGHPQFVRILRNCGTRPLLQRVSESLQVGEEEAGQLLRYEGFPQRGQGNEHHALQQAIATAAAEPLQVLGEELARTLSYINAHRRRIAPAQLYMVGGGASFRNITELLTHHLRLKTQVWTPMAILLRDGQLPATLPLLAQAIALSMLGWEAS